MCELVSRGLAGSVRQSVEAKAEALARRGMMGPTRLPRVVSNGKGLLASNMSTMLLWHVVQGRGLLQCRQEVARPVQ